MALDLNATPDDQGDEEPNLNQSLENEQDKSIHNPLEALGACKIKRGEVNLQVQFTAANPFDLNEPLERSLHAAGQSVGADALPSLFDDAPVRNVCHPFDLNLPQHGSEQENILTERTTSRNIDELIANVIKEYEDYDPVILNRVFLTLQGCMIEIMKDNGGNRYKIPHMNKERLEAMGMLPKSLSCDREIVRKANELLNN